MEDIILSSGVEVVVDGKIYILSNDTKVSEKVVETPQPPVEVPRETPTMLNKSGHPWFDGTSWGTK